MRASAPAVPVWDGREYPRYDPGEYSVRCIGFQGPEWVFAFRRWSIRLEFHFSFEEGTVSAFFNLGNDRSQMRVGKHSRYAKAWCMANGSAPRRGEEMSPQLFVDKWFRVRVEDASASDTGAQYSKVTEILALEGP